MFNIDYRIGLYLILINVITFILFSLDKKRAKSRQWRIPESTLLFVSLLGGAVGGLIGMQIFKHKTKKMKFVIGMPIILVFNIMILKYFATI
ncbi:MAG: DUF1294 domain-containing protein [Tissierellia bacterium]|nr:DUF1294 domain-containing protein [Tissierellia bacterium]